MTQEQEVPQMDLTAEQLTGIPQEYLDRAMGAENGPMQAALNQHLQNRLIVVSAERLMLADQVVALQDELETLRAKKTIPPAARKQAAKKAASGK